MAYLVDSDIVIDLLADDPPTVALLRQFATDGVSISAITYMEVFQGILRDPNAPIAHARFEAFVTSVEFIPVSREIAHRCAELRENLRRRGRRVRPRALDLLTAATALEHNLVLVTRNTEDYDDIPGLTLI